MALFEHPDFKNHEQVSFHQDKESGLSAIIAVHNTVLGPSLGGCRMYPYANSSDALTDVLRLSEGMSYKAAMANLPLGGGKSVIIGNPRTDKTPEMMKAMGRFVDSLHGKYMIAEDSGITVDDVNYMATQTRYAAGNTARYSVDGKTPDGNPAPSTSLGVFSGIQAAVRYKFNSNLEGKKVAIQGVGHVGLRLVEHLTKAGAQVFVSDIYDENLVIAKEKFNAILVENAEIFCLNVDVFAPCALGGAVNEHTIGSIKAPIIAGAANNQLARRELDSALFEREILYVPDYVINAGGIIDIHHQTLDNSSNEELIAKLEQIGDTVYQLLEKAEKTNTPTQQLANEIAEQRFA